MPLPADTHVHSEWSWDTGGPHTPHTADRMRLTCQRALAIGLPAVAFTEHLDFDGWQIVPDDLPAHLVRLVDDAGTLQPPPLDVAGYLDCVQRCRREFPQLQIHTGVEFGQPHLFEAEARALVDLDALDRVNGSLHTLAVGDRRYEPDGLFRLWPAEKVLWEYLAEVPRVVAGSAAFTVFTHIDYAVRSWPTEQAGPFDPVVFQDGFRAAMRAVAAGGRVLELNVGRALRPWIVQWWCEEGGRALSFGSDAHEPAALAANFPEAAALADYHGFRPGRRPLDFWTR